LDGLEIESVGFFGPLVCFTVIWYILWSFGIFWVRLVYFSRFGMLFKEISGNTATLSINGCQIFLGKIYQNVKICTKRQQSIPNGHRP
jgi:putative exporter of polyketide antibiotics